MTPSVNNFLANDYSQVHGSNRNGSYGFHATLATAPMSAPRGTISPTSTEEFDETMDASLWSVGSSISPYDHALSVHNDTYGSLPSSVASCVPATYDFTLSALQLGQLEDEWNPAHYRPPQLTSRVTKAPTPFELQAPPQKHVQSQFQTPQKPDQPKHGKSASTNTIGTAPTNTPPESNRPRRRRSKLSHNLVERRYREGVNQRITELAEHLSQAYPTGEYLQS
ncbi:hypothetical protein B0A49_09569 [Cryomyces minteri]|uniref:BHLH domain-containing protein n=1 Tax=Cryomyces minteri TaxID=331657 RepID=A0A4U0WNI2_9PEZI|nr:hypothetical protein B0A49_09569 [Cryomyces minteri]